MCLKLPNVAIVDSYPTWVARESQNFLVMKQPQFNTEAFI